MQAVVLVAGLLAVAPRYSFTQSTTATCGSQYSWMNNEKGQSPCLVAAYLNGQCLSVPAVSTVLPLEQIPGVTDYYAPPATGLLSPTDCNCNTVLYSLLAACGTCQGQGFATWSKWEANCPTVFVTKFPATIPSAVSVPQWAYLDVTSGNNFNISAAISLASEDKPDATSSSSSSSSGNSGSTSSHKKSIVGPVVGGVVGGLGGLAIVGLGIWYWLRRRNQRRENTPASGGVAFDSGNGTPAPQATPDIEKPGYIHAPSPLSAVDGVQQLQQQPVLSYAAVPSEQPQQQYHQTQALLASPPPSTLRPYNPDDPSTFPDALLYSPSSTQNYSLLPGSGQTSPVTTHTALSSNQTRPLSSVPEVSSDYVPSSEYAPPSQQQHQNHSPQQQQHQTGGGYQPTEF